MPRRLRADWRLECESELRNREALLADWDRLGWRQRMDLCRRSTGAFMDALWLQRRWLEEDMVYDLRFGIRMMLKTPVTTLVAIVTLALGIGANTAIFSLLDRVLIQRLPAREPDRLVTFAGEGEPLVVSYPLYERLHAIDPGFEPARVVTASFDLHLSGYSEARGRSSPPTPSPGSARCRASKP